MAASARAARPRSCEEAVSRYTWRSTGAAQAMPSRPAPSTRVHSSGASGPSPRTVSRSAPRTSVASWAAPRQASTPGGRRAERVGPVGPAAGPVDGVVAAHPLEGGDGGLGDGAGARRPPRPRSGRARRGRVTRRDSAGRRSARRPGRCAAASTIGGPVLGPGDGGETAGGGHVEGAAALQCPAGPSRRRPGRSSRGAARWAAAGAASGRRSPASWAARTRAPIASRGSSAHSRQGRGSKASRTAAASSASPSGVAGKRARTGGGEGAQPGVVVAQGQLVEGPGPVGAGRGVPAQQREGVAAGRRRRGGRGRRARDRCVASSVSRWSSGSQRCRSISSRPPSRSR